MANILIVEDDTTINEMVARNLKMVGHKCTQIYDGREGLEMIEKGDFDLVLLDVMLPGMSGFEVMEKTKDVPVIFVTAKGELDDKLHGLSIGAEDYIVKPFEMLELLVRVEKVLERHQKGREILKVGDVEIDTEKRSVTKAGEEIYLKPMEYDCLLMFVRHKNKALTREQLLKALWGVDFEGETRTVDAHVGRIRKKLGFQDVIRTIPRIGYRLEVDE